MAQSVWNDVMAVGLLTGAPPKLDVICSVCHHEWTKFTLTAIDGLLEQGITGIIGKEVQMIHKGRPIFQSEQFYAAGKYLPQRGCSLQ